ncbi:hypothetical protein JQX08_02870 [Pseudomonas sp. UL073]|uniref:Uncharacterized protein n=1 Tax=Zestomonas insulae TaxID=2809017 RepID=A0ABS2IBH2_9GAMM|nr:hypothetical protein [Pseudomonas insulae]MBM7059639.1 hypothetical protein [Pseudomonas insulae]
MNSKTLSIVLLCGLLAVAGCRSEQPGAAGLHGWIATPALPIIQDAVFSLSPLFNGQRNTAVMEQVCQLAAGEISQQDVNTLLAQQGVDPAQLPHSGDPLALLVNGDKAAQTTACAAFLATAPLLPVAVDSFLASVAAPSAADQPASAPRLAQVLPIKIAEARANAEIFAQIAVDLQRRPGLSVHEYRQQASQLFARLAPTYLQRVKQQMPGKAANYRLTRLDAEGFAFTGAREVRFEYGADGLLLHQHGVLWYGAGKLMGTDYPLQVAHFAGEQPAQQ